MRYGGGSPPWPGLKSEVSSEGGDCGLVYVTGGADISLVKQCCLWYMEMIERGFRTGCFDHREDRICIGVECKAKVRSVSY